MLRIPEDIHDTALGPGRSDDASVIAYENLDSGATLAVLVTRPTFVLVRSGTKQLQHADGQTHVTARSGQLLGLRAGTHLMSEFRGDQGGYRSLVVSVTRSFLRSVVGPTPLAAAAATAHSPRVVVCSPSPHVSQLFEQLSPSLEGANSSAQRAFLLRELVVGAMSDASVREFVFLEAASWGDSTRERMAAVIARHYLEPLHVPELAALCAMSLSSFKRHFRDIYHTSPGTWLSAARLKHARLLAVKSDATVSEICVASGYGDLSNFLRAFKREFGTSPIAMRNGAQPNTVVKDTSTRSIASS
ncbi:MAG: AraC-like DNA-binding protein [Bradymonadia bacterium]|jgi:AraC-like DNA-binding protein